MAITISFPAANISTDLTTNLITIVDGTTYTSPVRTAQGVFVSVYKTDFDGSRTPLATTANNADPASASTNTWTCPFTKDGWHQIFYVAAPTYSGGTTYAQYDAVYDPSTKKIYRSKSAGNLGNAISNTTFWELIPDATSLSLNVGTSIASPNLNTNTSVAIVNFGVNPVTRVAFGDQTAKAFLEVSSNYKRSQDVRNYELLGLAVDSMKIADARQNYTFYEIAARKASSIITNL